MYTRVSLYIPGQVLTHLTELYRT